MSRSLIAAVLSAVALTAAACGSDGRSRQDEVADRGAKVMPFDLERTTHRFTPNDNGLVQTVVADDADDAHHVDLVRAHLRAEAQRFQRGDFDDPAQIHGDEMPGLARLRAHGGAVSVVYSDIDAGGKLVYASEDAELVRALHEWGEAQTSDHGDHAHEGS